MSALNTSLNLTQHDDLYAEIVGLFDDISEADSMKAAAKLVLLLSNHIGDEQVVKDAVAIVRDQTKANDGDQND